MKLPRAESPRVPLVHCTVHRLCRAGGAQTPDQATGPAARLAELGAAVELAAENPRFAYVYAIGLHSTGKRDAVLASLRAAYARHPYDSDILGALVSMNREAGNVPAALSYSRKLAEVLPGDTGVTKLLAELVAGK